MRFILAGNPNVGKSSLFNVLTRETVHVGNWGGVTVSEHVHKIHKTDYSLIDLPGTYSTCPNSEDEGVVARTILNADYNGIVNILDAKHLKRNLLLTVQLLELGKPILICANMADELEKRGSLLDVKRLSDNLGVDVIKTSAVGDKSLIRDQITNKLKEMKTNELVINYGIDINRAIDEIQEILAIEHTHVSKRWIAIQILEGNKDAIDSITPTTLPKIEKVISETTKKVKLIDDETIEGLMFLKRLEFIDKALKGVITRNHDHKHSEEQMSKVDNILTHPIIGTFIFIGVLLLIFQLSFGDGVLGLGGFLTGLIETFLDTYVIDALANISQSIGLYEDSFLYGLVNEGIVSGLTAILVFVPQVVILFMLLAVLDGIGYTARVAVLFDSVLSKVGLNGKSIVPIISGFGCAVPAVMATRMMESKKERILTILTLSFISCGVSVPVYALILGNFMEGYAVSISLLLIYLLGIIVVLVSAKLFSLAMFTEESSCFVIEIPPIRKPQLNYVIHVGLNQAREFIKRVGTFMVIGMVIVFVLTYFGPSGVAKSNNDSFLYFIGSGIAPIFKPLGFGTWEASSALIMGFLAKENVAATLMLLNADFGTTINSISFVIFMSLYIPCLSTVAAIKGETKSWKYTSIAIGYPLVVAYITTFVFRVILLILL